jgi:uncharacterized protein YbcV (DUF1398 family)
LIDVHSCYLHPGFGFVIIPEPYHERANNNLHHYEAIIAQEEERIRKERRVMIVDKSVKNVRQLDSFRNTEEYSAYEKLCRGENTTNLV